MTEHEKIQNGLKFDTLEIREETEKLNFNVPAWLTSCAILEIVSTLNLGYAATIIISTACVIYGFKSLMGLFKLDFIFAGQFIRDGEAIAKFLTKKNEK